MVTQRQLKKEQTRKKILAASSALLKQKGLSETSVQKVMSEADLTHGSFYAYFKDKDDLVIQSFQWAVNESLERLQSRLPASAPARAKLDLFLKFYLSREHRAQVATGCPITALARDFSRMTPKFRKEFSKALNGLIENRRKLFSDEKHETTRAEWIGIMSCYVGALLLSRACESEPLADEILDHALHFLEGAAK